MGITARAPGKLIISGEHAVVYGYPALAIAVNRYADTTVRAQGPAEILFDFVNLPHKGTRTFNALRKVKRRVQNSYHAFLQGEKSIRDVLKKPFELLEFTTTNLIEKLSPHHQEGFTLHTHSTIPTGCGMGSSAATVISTNYALAHFLKKPIPAETLLQLGREAENLQHGKSSGLDLYLCVHGGCQLFQKGEAQNRPLPTLPLYMINTGAPDSSTGECVRHAASFFTGTDIGNQFEKVTRAIDAALSNHDLTAFIQGIKENHRLLCQIEVVPPAIQTLIAECEGFGFAAKTCGAGAVKGDKAGIVLVTGQSDIKALEAAIGLPVETVAAEMQGVRLL